MSTHESEFPSVQSGVPAAPKSPPVKEERKRRTKARKVVRPKPIYVLGFCQLGLFLIAVSYVLLVTGAMLTLASPWATAGKVCTLIGYVLLCSVILNKVYRAMMMNVALRKLKKPKRLAGSQTMVPPTQPDTVENRAS